MSLWRVASVALQCHFPIILWPDAIFAAPLVYAAAPWRRRAHIASVGG